MKKKMDTPAYVWQMWAILLLAIIGATGIPYGDQILYGSPSTGEIMRIFSPYQMTVNDFIYYISRDLILLLWAHIGSKLTGKLIAAILVRLAIGKIIDEFIHPFGYWWGEAAWDICVLVWAIYRWVKINRQWKENTVP